MLLKKLRPACIIIIILAGLFSVNTASFASLDNVVGFGDLNGFSNPANTTITGKTCLLLDHYQLLSNNVLPAIVFYSDFNGPYFGGSRMDLWTQRNYGLNFRNDNWGFGYNLVEDGQSVASGDTARLFQDFKDNSHPVGKIYDIGASGHYNIKEYMKFCYSMPVETGFAEDLRIGTSVNIINGKSYGKATITGQASVESTTTTRFDFDINADHNIRDTHGNGYGLDIGATCRLNDRLTFEMILENVLGQVYWQNVRNTEATGDTQNVIVDGSGNITNNPTISGTDSTRNITERLIFRSLWAASYKYEDNLSFLGMIEPYQDLTYYYIGSKWSPSDLYDISFGYGSRYDSVSVGIEYPFIKLMLFTDNISLSSATSMGILVSGTISE